MTARERKAVVRRVKRLHPESFKRVRSVCRYASVGFDLDYHAATIVLMGKRA